MAIEFRCSECGASLRAAANAAGGVVRCVRCDSSQPVPAARPASAEPEPQSEPTRPRGDAPPPRARPASEARGGRGPSRRDDRDDRDDRPRRRPRPEPRSPTKLIVGVCVLGALILLGGGALVWRAATKPAEWRTHESVRGGFKIDLPAPPRSDMAARGGVPLQPGAEVEGTVHRRFEYAVVWADFPNGRNPGVTDEQILDASIAGMGQGMPGARVTPGPALKIGPFNAREATVHAGGQGTYVTRVVVTESRLYVIAVGGPGATTNHPDVRRSVESFAVTDREMLAARERNLADERRAKVDADKAKEELLLKLQDLEDARRQREDAEARRQERQRRQDAERQDAETAAAAARFRAPQPGASAPDPTKLPGLKLYLSFDDVRNGAVVPWPRNDVRLPRDVQTGPGVRGRAAYLTGSKSGIPLPIDLLPADALRGPSTVAGWVKARSGGGADVLRASRRGGSVATAVGLMRREPGAGGGLVVHAALDTGPRAADQLPFPGEPRPGALSAPCPDDEKWHHVALPRTGPDRRPGANLYLDGDLVATFAFPPVGLPELAAVAAGQATDREDQVPAAKPDEAGDPPVAAADEICVFDRPLAPGEVRYLAGKAASASPAPAPRVRLVTETRIEPVAGIAFDPERKVVWAVSAVGGYWRPNEKPREAESSAVLSRYSYPDFRLTGTWALPENAGGNAVGGVPVFDGKNNRLFVPIGHIKPLSTHLQRDAARVGQTHRFDLDGVPAWEPGARPAVLTAAATLADPSGPPGSAAVSPDGKWFYYTARPAPVDRDLWYTAVRRVPGSLDGRPDQLVVSSQSGLQQPLWLSADGKTARVLAGVRPLAGGAGPARLGIVDIDTADWKARPTRDVFGLVQNKQSGPPPIALHPDGRIFVGSTTGVSESPPAAGAPWRSRPVPMRAKGFMAVSADGRFLFVADAETDQNWLSVLDARPDAAQVEELASVGEAADRRIGGPFFVSPDGRFVVFRSGQVVRLDDGTPDPSNLPVAPPPHVRPAVNEPGGARFSGE
jgi:hypothetical protein